MVVTGTVSRLEPRVSQRGNPYYTFLLRDGRSSVAVFSYGSPEIREGARVEVEGIFLKVKRVGRHTFQNQVDARRIRPL